MSKQKHYYTRPGATRVWTEWEYLKRGWNLWDGTAVNLGWRKNVAEAVAVAVKKGVLKLEGKQNACE